MEPYPDVRRANPRALWTDRADESAQTAIKQWMNSDKKCVNSDLNSR